MRFCFLTQLPFSRFPSYKRAAGMGEGLSRLGHEVFIAVFDCDENRRRMAFEAPHCRPVWFSAENALHEVIEKIRIIRKLCPDYVYVPTYGLRNLLGFRWTLPRRTKLVLEINELNSVFANHRWFWKGAERLGLAECDVQVCASRQLETYIRRKCERIALKRRIIYSPYAFPPYLNRARHLRSCSQTLVFMAALFKEYGVYDVMTAVHNLILDGFDLKLVIVGSGPELEPARICARRWGMENHIQLLGFVPEENIDNVLSLADAYVAPMRDTLQDRYRCPSKLFYYLAYGKPIITCRIGNPYDVLSENGFYYTPENIDHLKDAIMRALQARDFKYPDGFVSRHSWESRAKEFISDLQS